MLLGEAVGVAVVFRREPEDVGLEIDGVTVRHDLLLLPLPVRALPVARPGPEFRRQRVLVAKERPGRWGKGRARHGIAAGAAVGAVVRPDEAPGRAEVGGAVPRIAGALLGVESVAGPWNDSRRGRGENAGWNPARNPARNPTRNPGGNPGGKTGGKTGGNWHGDGDGHGHGGEHERILRRRRHRRRRGSGQSVGEREGHDERGRGALPDPSLSGPSNPAMDITSRKNLSETMVYILLIVAGSILASYESIYIIIHAYDYPTSYSSRMHSKKCVSCVPRFGMVFKCAT